MIYEIVYLLIFGFGGKYLLSLVNNWSRISVNVAKWINYMVIGLFFIAVIKFIYKLITGKYHFIFLKSNYDKHNAIYNILCDFKQKSKQLIKTMMIWFIALMLPSIYILALKIFVSAENALIIKYYKIYIGVLVWFLLFIYKGKKLQLLQFESILNSYLNKYSELLINNGGSITNEMKLLEDKAYQIKYTMRKIEVAEIKGAISGAASYAAGTYIGSKVGDAIVKNNNAITEETIIKNGKEVRVSKMDVFSENLRKELRKL